MIIGGGMAYTFVKAAGGNIGDSLCEEEYFQYTKDLLDFAAAKNVEIHLPEDVICANDFANDADTQITPIGSIPNQYMGLDSRSNLAFMASKNSPSLVLAFPIVPHAISLPFSEN